MIKFQVRHTISCVSVVKEAEDKLNRKGDFSVKNRPLGRDYSPWKRIGKERKSALWVVKVVHRKDVYRR